MIGVAGPQLGNFRGGVLGALIGAHAALALGGLAAAAVVVAVGAVDRPLREDRRPSDDHSRVPERDVTPAQ